MPTPGSGPERSHAEPIRADPVIGAFLDRLPQAPLLPFPKDVLVAIPRMPLRSARPSSCQSARFRGWSWTARQPACATEKTVPSSRTSRQVSSDACARSRTTRIEAVSQLLPPPRPNIRGEELLDARAGIRPERMEPGPSASSPKYSPMNDAIGSTSETARPPPGPRVLRHSRRLNDAPPSWTGP